MVKQGNLLALKTGTTTLTFWSASSGGTQYTDLLDVNSAPISSVIVSGYQIPRFSGPDGVTTLWAYDGRSDRFLMEARNPDFTGSTSKLDTNSFGKFVGLPTGVAATDTANINAALAAASADAKKPPVIFAPGTYVRNTAITPFTGMRLVALGRGSEFGYGTKIQNLTTDMFTPTADVSDIHIEGIQFEGNTATKATDWWTVGTGFQILYSHIGKIGLNGWKRLYHGNWTGVTFENFYANGNDQQSQSFKVGGSDNIWGPGFIGSGGFNRTTLTAAVTSGAGPKTITVADATGAAIGNPVYIGNQSDGASATRDVSLITNVAGTTLTIGTLANAHSIGEFVHIVLDTPAVETSMSHSLIKRLYISSGPGMALHVTGGHVSTFIGCELSGAPAVSAGSALYVIDGRGHQFIGTNVADVVLKPFDQFTGAITVYDSIDISFTGTLFNDLNTIAPQLFRLGRSGGGGVQLTDRIKIAGTSRYNLSSDHVLVSRNPAMDAANAVVICDEERPYGYNAFDRALKAENFPAHLATGQTGPATAGRLEFAKIRIPTQSSITNIVMMVITGGATLTAGQCFAALYTPAGALVAQTADQATAWTSVTLKTMALAGGPYTLPAGDYFVAFWYNGTTSPQWARGGAISSALINAGVATPNLFFGSADTGRTTTAPATMGTQTVQNTAWWVALS